MLTQPNFMSSVCNQVLLHLVFEISLIQTDDSISTLEHKLECGFIITLGQLSLATDTIQSVEQTHRR